MVTNYQRAHISRILMYHLFWKKVFIPCRILTSLFRYSGLVYHVAILSEAIYLMLLLKFPYYSESKGCKFCIFLTWSK
jgi:hypothetical protein